MVNFPTVEISNDIFKVVLLRLECQIKFFFSEFPEYNQGGVATGGSWGSADLYGSLQEAPQP